MTPKTELHHAGNTLKMRQSKDSVQKGSNQVAVYVYVMSKLHTRKVGEFHVRSALDQRQIKLIVASYRRTAGLTMLSGWCFSLP